MAGALATRNPVAKRVEDGSAEPRAAGSASRLFEPGGATLEDRILRCWDELVGEGRTECPVCSGSMSAVGGCESCASELR
jgi:hypothetical protein